MLPPLPRRRATRTTTKPARRPMPATQGWRWAVAGAGVGLLLASLIYAPARWLAGAVASASQGQLQLHGAQGSLWRGQAYLHLAPRHSGSYTLAQPWQWQLRPSWQGLALHLSAPDYTPDGAITLTIRPWQGRVQWQLPQLRLPLELLQGLGAPWNTLGLRGWASLQGQSGHWSWRGAGPHWPSALQWQLGDVASHLSTLPSLGSYQVNWQPPEGDTPVLLVRSLRGPLRIEGQGHWRNGRLRFSGQAEADPEQGEALSHLLTLIGQRSGHRSQLRWE